MTSDLNSNGVGQHLAKWRLWHMCARSPHVDCFILSTGVADMEASPLKDVARAVGHVKSTRARVHLLKDLSDNRAIRIVRDLKLHVLLDLNGYTEGERPALVNNNGGLAPLQMQFYGYEGSYGNAHAFGYILTDWGSASVDYTGPLPVANGGGRERGGEGMFAEKLLLLPPSKFPSGVSFVH